MKEQILKNAIKSFLKLFQYYLSASYIKYNRKSDVNIYLEQMFIIVIYSSIAMLCNCDSSLLANQKPKSTSSQKVRASYHFS